MKVYLFMATHLGEARQCLGQLAALEEIDKPVTLSLPSGLEWSVPQSAPCRVEPYDPATMLWVLDPDAAGSAFILLDPRLSPVPQLEKLAGDLRKCLIEPVKIVTMVDCAAVEKHPAAGGWFDAGIYYSDIVLLGNRAGAANRFVRDYQKQYQRNCYPCLFLLLKGPGNPEQPLEIVTPGTRRISQLFDLEGSAPGEAVPGMVIEASCDLDFEEEEMDPFRTPPEEQGLPKRVPDATPFITPAGN